MTDQELLREEVQVDVTNELLAEEMRIEPNCLFCKEPECWGDWSHFE